MSNATVAAWEAKRTSETCDVENALRKAGFPQADAYRYNSASIRVRVIDPRFDGLSPEQRDALVEPHLAQLPERTQADIMSLYTFAPSELQDAQKSLKARLMNAEFEDPSPSML